MVAERISRDRIIGLHDPDDASARDFDDLAVPAAISAAVGWAERHERAILGDAYDLAGGLEACQPRDREWSRCV